MARIIQSPGVQISEVDLSLRAVGAPPTTIFIPGFAQRGPTGEPINISSLSEFEQIYGAPTNAAERYFYHTVKAASQSPADIMVYRLPYGEDRGLGFGNTYSALIYPCSAYSYDTVTTDVATEVTLRSPNSLSADPLVVGGTYNIAASSILTTAGTGSGLTVTLKLSSTANTVLTIVNGGSNYAVGDTITILASSFGAPTSAANLFGTITDNVDIGKGTSNFEITSGAYFFGEPTHVKLTEAEYLNILRGDAFTWSSSGQGVTSFRNKAISEFGKAGLIIINKSQTTINSRYEGYYLNILDNSNLNPATPYDGITQVLSLNSEASSIALADYVSLPSARLNFALSASNLGVTDSISEVMENLSKFNIDERADDDTVAVGLFKLRQSVFSPDTIALDYVLDESYVGSFDFYRQISTETGGPAVPFFLETVDDSSRNIVTLINPYISNKLKGQGWDKLNGVPKRKVRFLSAPRLGPIGSETDSEYVTRMGAPEAAIRSMAGTLGTTNSLIAISDFVDQDLTTKKIGNVPSKVYDMFDKIENSDIYPLSITCEAGLGTVYLNSKNPATSGYFDDSAPFTSAIDGLTAQSGNIPAAAQEYLSVANEFIDFADKRRKDHLFIADPITNIFIQGGNNVKTLDDPTKNFSQNIYWPLRNQFSTVNSSYVCTFANVAKVADLTLNRQVWVPFSGFAAAAMGNTDATYYPWFAPAGFTRGVVTGVTDLGIYPRQKQRDLLYKISTNPVAFFPNEGFIIFGQKTMLKRPSAFDRINVRRLFLYLEVQTKNTAKFFVFEPNTLFTRTNVKNVLAPIFDLAKNTQGVYDYLIICDERNNTPDVIDDNSLVVDIYIKPVRAAEFILVNFYATRTGANFQEIVA